MQTIDTSDLVKKAGYDVKLSMINTVFHFMTHDSQFTNHFLLIANQ